MLTALRFELASVARRLGRAPASSLLAAGVLALGVAAATVLFALVRGIVLRPLPYPEPERLVVLYEDRSAANVVGWPTSFGRYDDYQGRAHGFDGGLAAARNLDAVLMTGDGAERLTGTRVSGNLFRVLGADPAVGRLLDEHDVGPEAPPAVVLAHGLWQRRFGADPAIVGRAVELDGTSHTVVGVAPRELAWPRAGIDFFVPLVASEGERHRAWYGLRLLGRLASESDLAAAQVELRSVAEALDREYPETDLGTRPRLVPLLDDVLGTTRTALVRLQGTVLLVLLVAAANFAGLLLARGAARQGELAMRIALGGERGDLVRLQLAEALVLGAIGAALGLGIAALALRATLAAAGAALPRATDVSLDAGVIAACLGAGLVAALVGALVPALLAGQRPDPEALRGGRGTASPRRRRALTLLVVLEIGSATALTVHGGLLLRSLWRLSATDPGFRTADLVTLEIGPSAASGSRPAEVAGYVRRLLTRLRDRPAIEGVSAISRLPVVGSSAATTFEIEGRPMPQGDEPVADIRYVEPGALELLGVQRLAGRALLEDDGAEAPLVLLVNRAFVARHFPDGDAVGRRLWVGNQRGVWRTIVGVVGDVHLAELERPVEPTLWLPMPQAAFPSSLRTVALVARSRLAAGAALADLESAIEEFDARQAPMRPRTLGAAVSSALSSRRFQAGVFVAFAAIAALLSGAGIYGITAHSVAQRRAELGVRLALGADAAALGRLVLGEGMRLAGIGLALGVIVALASQATIAPWLVGVRPWDPTVAVAVATLVLVSAALASFAPALRAARTPPAVALRGE